MTMFDNQIIKTDIEPTKGSTILLVPVDTTMPDDVKLPVFDWSWEGLVSIFSTDDLPAILRADANDDQLITALARFRELTLKTLQGLPTNYPAHWQITFSGLPKLTYQELILAKENSKVYDGNGIQPEKQPRVEMKPLDPSTHSKLAELARTEWAEGNVD